MSSNIRTVVLIGSSLFDCKNRAHQIYKPKTMLRIVKLELKTYENLQNVNNPLVIFTNRCYIDLTNTTTIKMIRRITI